MQIPVLVLKEALHGSSLRYQKQWDHFDCQFAPGQSHLHDLSIEWVHERQTIWVLLWRWDRHAAYETHLEVNDISFTKYEMGGMPELILYRLSESR